MKYYSQYEQDKIINEIYITNNRNGVFVDIGAHDGIFLSNSYFFEKHLGWKGICIEPNPDVFAKLKENRSCDCLNIGVNDIPGKVLFQKNSGYTETLSGIITQFDNEHVIRIQQENTEHSICPEYIEIECDTLNNILDTHNYDIIDFMSIDTEGSEYNILKDFNFNKYHINLLCVELNYPQSEKAQKIFSLLKDFFPSVMPIRQDFVFINNNLRFSYENNST